MSYDVGTRWEATSLNKTHSKPQRCIDPYMTEPYKYIVQLVYLQEATDAFKI